MSKYSDLAYILDYMNNFKKDSRRSYREDRWDDPMSGIMKMKRTVDEWHKFQKDLEKIHKEDKIKKDDMSFMQKFIVLTALVPFIAFIQLGVPALIIIKVLGLH